MDETTQGQAPATDDQELAKVLAGMNEQAQTLVQPTDPAPATDAPAADPAATTTPTDPMQYEAAALPTPAPADPAVVTPDPVADPVVEPATTTPSQLSPELETLKKDALEELRPLVDKLDLPAEEKFDTLLLIIRSTDDQSLLGAAHDAAKSIENETKRAQALLDVIKEIDFFATQKTA